MMLYISFSYFVINRTFFIQIRMILKYLLILAFGKYIVKELQMCPPSASPDNVKLVIM